MTGWIHNNRQRLSFERLDTRAQHEGEGFTSYIENVLWFCRRSNAGMPEVDKRSHLMKGVTEDSFQLLVGKSSSMAAAFCANCPFLRKHDVLASANRFTIGSPMSPFRPLVGRPHSLIYVP